MDDIGGAGDEVSSRGLAPMGCLIQCRFDSCLMSCCRPSCATNPLSFVEMQSAFVNEEVEGIVAKVRRGAIVAKLLAPFACVGFQCYHRGSLAFPLVLQIVHEELNEKVWQEDKIAGWMTSITEKCTEALVELGKPFKYLGKHTIAMEWL
jgi:hypothetical protein